MGKEANRIARASKPATLTMRFSLVTAFCALVGTGHGASLNARRQIEHHVYSAVKDRERIFPERMPRYSADHAVSPDRLVEPRKSLTYQARGKHFPLQCAMSQPVRHLQP
jgi:hypothetical protein